MLKYTILILTFNRFEAVQRCFESLRPTLYRDDVQTVVLDNCSTDLTKDYIAGLAGGKHTTLLMNENLGVAAGRARLLKEARGKYIIFLDSDTMITDPMWIDRLGEVLDKNESVGLVGPGGSFVKPDFSQFTAAAPNAQCDTVAGFCQCFRASLLDMGLHLDVDNFPKFWGEDSDWCMQIRDLGWDIYCLPVGVEHHSSHSGYGQDMALHAEHLKTFKGRWQGKKLTKAEGAY